MVSDMIQSQLSASFLRVIYALPQTHGIIKNTFQWEWSYVNKHDD